MQASLLEQRDKTTAPDGTPPAGSQPRPPSATRRWLRWTVGFLLVFMGITAARFEVITSPPYFDFAMGVFTEANFLAETNFDYYRLWYLEEDGLKGGPRAYLTSVIPTLLALVMKVAPSSVVVLVVSHLVSFACGAAIVVVLFSLLVPHLGRWPAGLTCWALLTTPLFSTQVDMLGIDLPLATCATFAALALCRQRYVLAIVAATVSFFVKASGLVVSVAVIAYLVALAVSLFLTRRKGDGRWLAHVAAALTLGLVSLGLEGYLHYWSGIHGRLRELAGHGARSFLGAMAHLCPDQLLVFLFCLVITVSLLFRRFRQERAAGSGRDLLARLLGRSRLLLAEYPLPVFAWIIVLATPTAIVGYSGGRLIRYLTVAMPFLYALLGIMLFEVLGWRRRGSVVLLGLAAVNLVNWNGVLFPVVRDFPRHCNALERSHEYLPYHRAEIEAMRLLEAKYADTPIVAGHPYSYYLSLPRLGFIQKPLHGYCINRFTNPNFPDVAHLFEEQSSELIFMWADNACFSCAEITVPPLGPDDELIFRDQARSPLVIFRKSLAKMARTPDDREKWLLNHLWFDDTLDPSLPVGLAERAHMLNREGRADLAIRLLQKAVAKAPDDDRNRLVLGQFLFEQARYREAAAQFAALLSTHPNDVHARYHLGLTRERQGRLGDAAAEFLAVTAADPGFVDAHFRLGALQMREANPEARARFEQVIKLQPQHALAHNNLGVVLTRQGKYELAAKHFREALRLAPGLVEASKNLHALEAKRLPTPPDGAH